MFCNEIGCYLKTVRLYKGISKKEISEQCNVPIQTITRIENDFEAVQVKEELMNKWLNSLGIQSKYKKIVEREYDLVIDEFIGAYISDDRKCMKKCIHKLSDVKEVMENISFSKYLLMSYIYTILYDYNVYKVEFIGNILHKLTNQMDERYKGIYYLATGVYFMRYRIKNIKEAKEYFYKIINSYQKDECYYALAHFYISIMELRSGKIIDSYHSIKKSNRLFQKSNEWRRYVHGLSILGIIYISLNEEELAFKQLNESKRLALLIHDEYQLSRSYMYSSWAYVMLEKYEFVADEIINALQEECLESMIYFYNSYAYYKLGMTKLCGIWIEKGLHKCKDNPDMVKLLYFVKSLNAQKMDYTVLMEILNEQKQYTSLGIDTIKILYRELIYINKQQGNYKESLDFIEEYQKLVNKMRL